VVVAVSQERDAPITVSSIGAVKAFSVINVRAHIAGTVAEKHFIPGQRVKKGDVLYQLDDRARQAALAHARAKLNEDIALAAKAKIDADQKKDLLSRGAATQFEYNAARYAAAAADAAVTADEATLQGANVMLDYCTIHSPIDGYVGPTLVDAGNVVEADNTTMVVLRQVSPIYVEMSVPQDYLNTIRDTMAQRDLTLRATIPAQADRPIDGRLAFVNNTVDEDTGTITVRGVFANEDVRLWPGQYVNATLVLGVHKDAVLVPATALQSGQQGEFVWVIDSQHKAQKTPVTVGDEVDGQIIIKKGLAAGQTVVVQGQLRLTPGAAVEIVTPKGEAVEQAEGADANAPQVTPSASSPTPAAPTGPAAPAPADGKGARP
jgi:membrane fusion protein, multidrug efflux system